VRQTIIISILILTVGLIWWGCENEKSPTEPRMNYQNPIIIINAQTTIEVLIDIKPGSDPNPVNCQDNDDNGVIPVAILTTDVFDATTVDHTTVTFGVDDATEIHIKKKSGKIKRHEEDVDLDGDTDLVFHFRSQDTGIVCGDSEVTLTGLTFGGIPIIGSDFIKTKNDIESSISISDAPPVSEGLGNFATFTVTISNPSAVPVTVNYQTADGTATAGSDYTATSGTLTFAPGETTKAINVPILDDAILEGSETFNVDLSNPTNATILDDQGEGTILDNDTQPTIDIDDVAVNESDGIAVFTVSLSDPSVVPVTVDYQTANGTATAGSDYTATSGTLTFNPGDPLTKTISVPIIDDLYYESSETFNVNLSNPTNAIISDDQGLGTIIDDIDITILTLDNVSASEGGTATITGHLNIPPQTTLIVTLSNGATMTFSAGSTTTASTSFLVQTEDVYVDAESYIVTVSSTAGGNFESLDTIDTALVNVSDTIDSTTLSLSGPSAVTEGGIATYTLSVNNPPQTDLQVSVQIDNITSEDADFSTLTPGSPFVVTLPAGGSSVTFDVNIFDDNVYEGTENYSASIVGTTGGNYENLGIGSSSVTTGITDSG
jgi:hypothetical protein